MARPGEFEYYSTRSGLPAGTLNDHQRAFWATSLSLDPAAAAQLTWNNLAKLYFFNGAELPAGSYTLPDVQYAYFKAQVPALTSGTVDDYMAAFFLNPPAPGPGPNTIISDTPPGVVGDKVIQLSIDPDPDVASVGLYTAGSMDGVSFGSFSKWDDATYDGTKFWTYGFDTVNMNAGEYVRIKFRNNVGPVDIGTYIQFQHS